MQQMPPPLLFLGRARSKNSWPPKSRKQGIEELRGRRFHERGTADFGEGGGRTRGEGKEGLLSAEGSEENEAKAEEKDEEDSPSIFEEAN